VWFHHALAYVQTHKCFLEREGGLDID